MCTLTTSQERNADQPAPLKGRSMPDEPAAPNSSAEARTFEGVFHGPEFGGRFTGRDGHITYEEDGKKLRIWWELGFDWVLVGKIPCRWEGPSGEFLPEQHQRDILESLREWLRIRRIPSDLANDPWVNATDDASTLCTWADCGSAAVVGYSICRWHILRGYLDERPTQPV